MKEFTEESQRYEYDLNADSFVIDAGGYKGDFAFEIGRKYGCRIVVFEPLFHFYLNLLSRFLFSAKVLVVHSGIWKYSITKDVSVNGDSSGIFTDNIPTLECNMMRVDDFIKFPVDLLKLNVEGAEFDVLEDMIQRNIMGNYRNIQVQFHNCAPNPHARYESIHESLLKTHEVTWSTPHWDHGWTNYRLR